LTSQQQVLVGLTFALLSGGAFLVLWLGLQLRAMFVRSMSTSNPPQYVVGTASISATTSPSSTAGPLASFDSWFARSVRDSGFSFGPSAAVGLILGIGVLIAGAIYLVWENELASAAGATLAALLCLGTGIWLARRRQRQAATQLPGWIDGLARSLRAGRSLEQALRSSLTRLQGPLAIDLRRGVDRLDLGLRVSEAFGDVVSHYRSLELQMVIGALSMHRQTGGDLPTALERLATVARQRQELRRQAWAASSSARFAAICLALAPPAILAYYYFTEQFVRELLVDPSGQFALALAAGLELVGLLWMAFLVREEV
jgi:tight adherence protein B